MGIDLAGSVRRPTGFCAIDGGSAVRCSVLFSDEQILRAVKASGTGHVAVDAPLALPKGRHCIGEHCRGRAHFRACDRILMRMRIKFFPITIGPMRQLTARGIRLRRNLEDRGLKVVETFPGGAQDLLGIPRKQHGAENLQAALVKMGCRGDVSKRRLTGDELDAINCALVARDYAKDNYIAIGDPSEILMVFSRL